MDLLDTDVFGLIGEDGFSRLVTAFYRQIPADDILGPMYLNRDLLAAEHRLRDFLVGRFGGPLRYVQTRGHPRLRMRHAPFQVNQTARNRWMSLMDGALAEAQFPEPVTRLLRQYLETTATFMINA